MSCNYELTQDRIKAAIFEADQQLNICQSNIDYYSGQTDKKNWDIEGELTYWNRVKDIYLTQLAALDAVRWRDMATEPPTCNERCRILVIFKGERGEGKPVMLTYDPEDDPYFNKFEDSHFVNTRYSPTDGEESYGLPVWQHNIDKWRPVVW